MNKGSASKKGQGAKLGPSKLTSAAKEDEDQLEATIKGWKHAALVHGVAKG